MTSTDSSTPAGYHSVTPSLVVRGVAQAIEFYQRAFGAEVVSRLPGSLTARAARPAARA